MACRARSPIRHPALKIWPDWPISLNAPVVSRAFIRHQRGFSVMKKLLVIAALAAAAPVAAHAECTAKDFTVQDFKVLTGRPNQPMRMPGKLVNHCSTAAAAQVQIIAKAADGSVVESKKGWPAGTANIAPGKDVRFDMGRMFRFKPSMHDYTLKIVSVRTW
jgi:hypothetical protein